MRTLCTADAALWQCFKERSLGVVFSDSEGLEREPVKTFTWDELADANLIVDACYMGGREGNAGDDPLNRLVDVSN